MYQLAPDIIQRSLIDDHPLARLTIDYSDNKLTVVGFCAKTPYPIVIGAWPDLEATIQLPFISPKPANSWADSILDMELLPEIDGSIVVSVQTADGIVTIIEPPDTVLSPDYQFDKAISPISILTIQQCIAKQQAVAAYLKSIPPKAMTLVKQFTNNRWRILQNFKTHPHSVDLCESNPALLYITLLSPLYKNVASQHGEVSRFNWNIKYKDNIAPMNQIITSKQTDILDMLGFTASKTFVSLFKKIKSSTLTVNDLDTICTAFRKLSSPSMEAELKVMQHLDVINANVLAFVTCDSPLAKSFNFMHAISTLDRPFSIEDEMRDLKYTERLAEKYERTDSLIKCASFKEYEALRDELTAQLDAFRTYPKPPFIGNQHIQPIISTSELMAEGTYMHNCIYGYHENILSGKYYVYKVTEPIRATLTIHKKKDVWVIDDYKGRFNRNIPEQLKLSTIIKNTLFNK